VVGLVSVEESDEGASVRIVHGILEIFLFSLGSFCSILCKGRVRGYCGMPQGSIRVGRVQSNATCRI
jgi:hypothetical protein